MGFDTVTDILLKALEQENNRLAALMFQGNIQSMEQYWRAVGRGSACQDIVKNILDLKAKASSGELELNPLKGA